jgi:pyruvate formate lyase activating enzyme
MESLIKAQKIGMETGLKYVYVGNVSGLGGEDTHCPSCKTRLIKRHGFSVMSNIIKGGKCPECGYVVEGVV